MTESIVLNVCKELRVDPQKFFKGARGKKYAKARRLAVKRLREAEFSYRGISRAMRCNYSTVLYWVHPEYRVRKAAYYKRRLAMRGCPSVAIVAPDDSQMICACPS